MQVDGDIAEALEAALGRPQSKVDRDKQRLSFAFGNGLDEGEHVSRASLKEADRRIRSRAGLAVTAKER